MLKRIIDFLLYPFHLWLKALEESDNWFRDESSKAFSDGDIGRAMMLHQIMLENLGMSR